MRSSGVSRSAVERCSHHGAAELSERCGAERLGQCVGDHELRGDVFQDDGLLGNLLADEVVTDVDVTGAVVGDLVQGESDGTLVVFEKCRWLGLRVAKFGELASGCESLLNTCSG